MGLITMIVGLALLLGAHAFTTRREARAAVIARIGEWPYKAIYSVISLIGLILIGYGFGWYRATDWIEVWHPPAWTRHVTVTLMWPASICIAAAYIRGDIQRKLKHPMLVGVKLWATAHLISNGDLGSIILFGSILAWAAFDRVSLKHRTDPGGPAISTGGRRNDVIAIVAGTLLYFVLGFLFHPLVVGVPAFGTPALGR